MTFPTLQQIFDNISTDLKNEFGISSENDLKRVLVAIAASNAGFLKLLYLLLKDVQKNVFADTADPEENGGTLDRFGRVKLNRERRKATTGVYDLNVTGVIGGVIPVGAQFKSGENSAAPNQLFETTESLTLSGTTGIIEVESLLEGTDYALTVNDELFLVNPITNIDNLATVDAIVTAATPEETVEEYRDAILTAFRLESQGGAASDYRKWSLDVTGMRTVYPYTTPGASGEVDIYAEALPDYSTDTHGTPSTAMLEALWKNDFTGVFERSPDTSLPDYERGRRQLGLTLINIIAVTPKNIIVTITNLKDESATEKAKISAALETYLYNIRPFISGIDDYNNKKDTITVSDLFYTISNAVSVGNTFDSVAISGAYTVLPHTFENGDIPYLASIVYA